METRIEIMSSAEAEIVGRAVQEIAELREEAMKEAVLRQQYPAFTIESIPHYPTIAAPAAAAIERTADAIEEAGVRRASPLSEHATVALAALDVAAAEVSAKTVPTIADAVAAFRAASARGAALPVIVEFLAKHNVKRVSDLAPEALPEFMAFIARQPEGA